MVLCRPAERVCCGCVGIHQAAQCCALFFVIKGIVAIVSLVALGDGIEAGRKLTPISEILEQMDMFYRIVSLWVGVRGYTGVTFKSPTNLRVLVVFCWSYSVFLLCRLFRLAFVCEEYPELDCEQVKAAVVGCTGLQFFFYGYVGFILWSSLEKIVQAGSEGMPLFQLEEGLMTAPPIARISDRDHLRGAQQIEPFSGEAHRLE